MYPILKERCVEVFLSMWAHTGIPKDALVAKCILSTQCEFQIWLFMKILGENSHGKYNMSVCRSSRKIVQSWWRQLLLPLLVQPQPRPSTSQAQAHIPSPLLECAGPLWHQEHLPLSMDLRPQICVCVHDSASTLRGQEPQKAAFALVSLALGTTPGTLLAFHIYSDIRHTGLNLSAETLTFFLPYKSTHSFTVCI